MRILVDADACPVLSIVENMAQKNNIALFVFSDLAHKLEIDYGQMIRVDKRNQAVDMAIVSYCVPDDVVITQDYGLAALVLSCGAEAINFKGLEYKTENIDYLLMKRHIHSRIRRAGGRYKGPKKRSKEDDKHFKRTLQKLIKLKENK